MKQSKKLVIAALGWKFFERLSFQGSNFIVTLVLARLLTPDEYGIVSLILVFTSLAAVFVQGGFNTALIQKKDVDDDDYISVLLFSLGVAIVLYILLFFLAEPLSMFYKSPQLCPTLRVTSVILFTGAINSVQVANVTKDLHFKVLYKSSLYPMIIAAIIGIALAYHGFGVWALVIQQIVSQVGSCIVMYLITKWWPIGKFSKKSIQSLIPFGSKILASNFLIQVFMNLRSMIIGRVYTSEALGYFNRGRQFPQAAMESINGTIQSVLLPIYSKEQEKKDTVLKMVRTSIQLTSFIVFPLLTGLACVAEPLVKLLLTDKWLPCVPYLQLFVFSYFCQPAQLATAQAYKALGDSTTPLYLEVVRKVAEIGLLIISMRMGIVEIAASSVVAGIIALTVTLYPNVKKFNYSIGEQLSDLIPSLLLSASMAGIILYIGSFIDLVFLKLLVEVILGIVSYIGLAFIFKVRILYNILHLFKGIKRNRHGEQVC